MPPKKPAIALGPIDDIVKAVVKQILTNKTVQSAGKKRASAAFKKGDKAFSKMEKIGGITKSVDPKKSSPKKVIKKYTSAQTKYNSSMDKYNKLNGKYRGGR